jgi:hypothetical protein
VGEANRGAGYYLAAGETGQRQAHGGPSRPLSVDLTISWSTDISIFHTSLGAAVQRARDETGKHAGPLAAGLLAEVDQILRDANKAALAFSAWAL